MLDAQFFWSTSLDRSRFCNGDSFGSLSILGSEFLNFLDNVKAFDNFAKDNVFSIKPAGYNLQS